MYRNFLGKRIPGRIVAHLKEYKDVCFATFGSKYPRGNQDIVNVISVSRLGWTASSDDECVGIGRVIHIVSDCSLSTSARRLRLGIPRVIRKVLRGRQETRYE
jgi:hypothetical protein